MRKPILIALTLAALPLAACTSETTVEESTGENGLSTEEITEDTTIEADISDPVAREQPVQPEENGAKSAETDQPMAAPAQTNPDVNSPNPPPS